MGARQDAYQEVTDRIVAALEAGTVPWHQPWRTIGGPRSYAGRPYRGVNVWLLELEAMEKGYGDPRWITFNAAKQAGGTVRKGERSTTVYLWKSSMVRDRRGAGELEPAEGDEDAGTRRVFWLRAFRVFNVEQCDGLEPYVAPELAEHDPIVAADALMARYLEAGGPAYSQGGDRAFYRPATDEVRVPVAGAFESVGAFYGTAFHELVHSTGHRSRLDRPEIQAPAFGTEPYAREELVAELGAAMLCGVAGVDRGELEESSSYIAGWLRRLQDDRRLIVNASAAAQKAADMIAGTVFEDRETVEGSSGADPAPFTRRPFEDKGHRPMFARFAGTCGYCGAPIKRGDAIHYRKGEGVACVACVVAAEHERPEGTPVEAPAEPLEAPEEPAGELEPKRAQELELEDGAAVYRLEGTTFEARVLGAELLPADPALLQELADTGKRQWKNATELERTCHYHRLARDIAAGVEPRFSSSRPVGAGRLWNQEALYVQAVGRDPRTIVDVLRARGVDDPAELERASAQWNYRSRRDGDPLELGRAPARELVAA